jgi:hypothetical protein
MTPAHYVDAFRYLWLLSHLSFAAYLVIEWRSRRPSARTSGPRCSVTPVTVPACKSAEPQPSPVGSPAGARGDLSVVRWP